ncbi:MAG: hypothetical protein WD848_04300 [Dehalococcoidia bacterium]
MIYAVNLHTSRGLLGPSPTPLFNEIQRSRSWWHYLPGTWLVSTPETIHQLDARLRQHMHPADKLLIVPFSEPYAGWLPQDAWDWISQRIDAGDMSEWTG